MANICLLEKKLEFIITGDFKQFLEDLFAVGKWLIQFGGLVLVDN